MEGSGEEGRPRHCSVCLQTLTTARVCGGCHRRAYCSAQCQARDWKANGGGQSHKIWCKLRCGEEDIDWVVPSKGLGLVALRPIPARSRILVDAVRQPSDPVVLDLEPQGAPLPAKIKLNQLGISDDSSVVCARLSRVNHSCDANAAHYFDTTYQVVILFSCRDIAAGEEITIAYKALNDPGVVRTPEQVRRLLQEKYQITCPPTCLCYNVDFHKICVKAHELDQRMQEQVLQPQRSLATARQLLGLFDAGLRGSLLSRNRYLHAAWQVAISSRKTLPQADAFIQEAIALLRDLVAPSSSFLLEMEGHARMPSSYPTFLILDGFA